MNTSTKVFYVIGLLICSLSLSATHNRAGEISYSIIGNTVTAVIRTYTNTNGVTADRDSLPINWGDGTTDIVPRMNSTGQPIPNNVKLNIYEGTHTYAQVPASGFAILSTQDPNRNSDIINIQSGNSVNVQFYIQDTIWFTNNNNGPILLYPPIDYGYVGDTFFHNPAAYDIEADSLTFELAIPLQAQGINVPAYVAPSLIPSNGPDNVLTIDHLTGEIIWAAPQTTGIYNIAILIHEYRYGTLLSTMTRDMVIEVLHDTVAAPRLSGSFTDTVITPGTALSLPYDGSADAAYRDSLSGYGGIFNLPSGNAYFNSFGGIPAAAGELIWNPGHNLYKQRETRIVAIRSLQQSVNLQSNIRAFRVTVVDTSITTGVAEILSAEEMVIYPVPARDRLYLSSSFPSNGSITDMIGREWNAKISEEEIDISDIPPGIYLFRWQNEGKTFSKRFIKE